MRFGRLAASVLALSLLSSCGSSGQNADAPPSEARATPRPSGSVAAGVRKFRSAQQVASVAAPKRLRIPTMRVDTTLEHLGKRSDGTVDVPKDWQRAGWYREGPRPGEPGSAVVLGHVDSPQGRAVFTGLARLRAGTRIHVDGADGTTVTFRVTRVEEHLQADFPTDMVYLPTVEPELRLITCGGRYIASRGGYQSNVIVFATAESSERD